MPGDLTDFLLARIAEDEATVTAALADPTRWDAGDWIDRAWSPVRVMAECEAKRQIIKAVADHRDGEWEDDPIHEMVLEPMAAVYADHPDYRGEWRV
jgi:hypothetical protein